jgi:hypothetical protein
MSGRLHIVAAGVRAEQAIVHGILDRRPREADISGVNAMRYPLKAQECRCLSLAVTARPTRPS